ncbi:hypothetical protein BJ684DRAFT_18904 [Piptocephalis cylindrospora]|uniref:Uncharacterized protein n=1 Tax=Piptocephalis cylindrospora TaxID=1907219 RepID=A0A4P9Y7I6_9FUNG|nr:hypothetical protein BJ684DRAFT_18904 [Piptocephalis cylindrospora]|eukprot:RKP14704.1 hypothetical protein BJ684DRAFT_18904 [Piptocephalis cylindrospora]
MSLCTFLPFLLFLLSWICLQAHVSAAALPPSPNSLKNPEAHQTSNHTTLVSTSYLLSPVPPSPVYSQVQAFQSNNTNATISDGTAFRPVILHGNGTQIISAPGAQGLSSTSEASGIPFHYTRTFAIPPKYFGLWGSPEWHLFVEEPSLLFSDPTLSVTHSPFSSLPTSISPHAFKLIKVKEDSRLPYDTYFFGHDRSDGRVLCLTQGWLWTGLRFRPCSPATSLRVRGVERNEATGVTRMVFLDSSGVLGTERCLKIRTILGPKAHLESCQDGDPKEFLSITDPSNGAVIDLASLNMTMVGSEFPA